MRTKFALILAVLVIALIAVPSAQAFVWEHVGGDPLIPGGVWSSERFSYYSLNSDKVQTAFNLVRKANGQPTWVMPNAYDAIRAGKIYAGGVPKGTNLGAMSYGRNSVRVVKNCLYMGQYDPLPIFYTVSSKTTVVKISGKFYSKTVSYRVSLAKPCGNVFIYHKRVVKKRLYDLRVEKRLETASGQRLAGWQIKGKAGNKDVNLTTKSTGSVLVGRYLAGTKYNLAEVLQDGWEVVAPNNGTFAGKMPKKNLTLRFVNRKPCEPTHKLYVQKQEDCSFRLLAGWVISGTVGGAPVSVTTQSTGPTLVGEYVEGTTYNLSETLKEGWEIVSPASGNYTGTMPAHDVTLTFVNRPYNPPPPPPDEYCVFVKKINADGGAMIGGWGVTGTLAGTQVAKSTSASGWVLLGTLEEGEAYFVSEESRADWFPVSPTTGSFTGVMGDSDVYLTFSNRYCPPETPKYKLWAKKINYDTNQLIAGWPIYGTANGIEFPSQLTRADGAVLMGEFEAGTEIYIFEGEKLDWVAKTPAYLNFVMPAADKTVTFTNQYCPPEPEKYCLFIEVRQDTVSGPRLSNWTVQGYGDGSWYSVLSSSADWVRVDCFTEGSSYDLSLVMQSGWELVSPSGGRYSGTMPNHNVYLTYVVRRCPPPHELTVRGEVSPLEHVDQEHLSVTLDAIVLTHTDGDSLTFSWYVNGVKYDTILTSYFILLEYETVYNVTLVATDKQGHTAQYTLAPFNFQGPSDPPPPPPD